MTFPTCWCKYVNIYSESEATVTFLESKVCEEMSKEDLIMHWQTDFLFTTKSNQAQFCYLKIQRKSFLNTLNIFERYHEKEWFLFFHFVTSAFVCNFYSNFYILFCGIIRPIFSTEVNTINYHPKRFWLQPKWGTICAANNELSFSMADFFLRSALVTDLINQ